MNGDALSIIGALIGNLGFPIAITIYVLIRFDRLLSEVEKESNQAIRELADEVRRLSEELARFEGLLTASLRRNSS